MIAKGKKMSKQAIVLETINKRRGKGGMTSDQLSLANAQSEDYEVMKKEIQDLKSEVSDVKKEVGDVKIQLERIKGNIDILLENSKLKSKLIDSKYFWATIMLLLLLIAGIGNLEVILKLFGV